MNPELKPFNLAAYHRLIPSRYSQAGTVLAEVADDSKMLRDLILLDGATNDRIQGEQHGLAGIGPHELLYGVANSHIVNAAFTHTSEAGSRFNDHTRGAWYAAAELETSIAEVAYHKARRLSQIVVPDLPFNRPDRETATYDDWLADFQADFHLLDPPEKFSAVLIPEPVPACYRVGQELARRLLAYKSNGIIYPSVRRPGARCIACFRPALVYRPRFDRRLEITFRATSRGYQHQVKTLSSRKSASKRKI